MGRSQRDAEHHTYADYLTWHDDLRYERIDGVAYSMAPAPTLAHQDVVGEIYRLEQGAYGRPDLSELVGDTPVGLLPGVNIQWEAVLRRLPAHEDGCSGSPGSERRAVKPGLILRLASAQRTDRPPAAHATPSMRPGSVVRLCDWRRS